MTGWRPRHPVAWPVTWPVTTWINSLDPLRGTAALALVAHHSCQAWRLADDGTTVAATLLAWLGAWGVALFFVLSGFCIHLPHARAEIKGANRIDWRHFARRRAKRLLPTHYAALILSAAVAVFIQTELLSRATPGSFLAHIFMVHVWYGPWFYSINTVFWTIAVEVHFYICYPLYLYLRHALGSGAAVLALGAAGLLVYFAASKLPEGPPRLAAQHLFLVSWWQWAAGAAVADLYLRGQAGGWAVVFTGRRMPAAWIAGSILVGLKDPTVGGLHIRFWLLPLFCTGIVAALVTRTTRRIPVLSSAGMYSYSIYLVHPVVLALIFGLSAIRSSPAVIGVPVVFVCAVVGARAFFEGVEKHFLPARHKDAAAAVI